MSFVSFPRRAFLAMLGILSAGVLVLLATLGTPATASGHCDATVEDGQSIQAAIDAAIPGDTICVEAGTYPGNLALNATKSGVTLEGAKAGLPAGPEANPANRGSDESVIQGRIEITQSGATAITVDGFTIESGTLHGVHLRGSSHTIVNNMLEAAFTDSLQAGIFSQDFSDAYVAHNNFRDYRQGMNLDGGIANLKSTIEGNYLTGSRLSTVFFQASMANGHTIRENLLEDTRTGILVTQGEHEITDNTVRDVTNPGIWLVAIPANAARTHDLSVNGNVVQDNEWGIIFGQGPGHEAQFNCIEGNDNQGLRNDDADNQVDATNNWWGAANGPSGDGPGDGDVVEGNVLFEPFLTDPSAVCPPPPPPPDPTTKDECKNGGWEDFGFRNQGQCIQFVNTGRDSR